MGRRQNKPSDAIRRAIEQSGVSRYAIAKAAKVDEAVLSRYMASKAAMTTTTLDALAAVLGLRIVAEGPVKVLPPGKRGRPKAKKKDA